MPETVVRLSDAAIYQGKTMVLNEINFEMQKGDFIYLIGKTGTGKSSFLKTLYGDLELNHGEGSIVGFDLANLKEKDIPFLRRKLGIVFQDFKLFTDRTVSDNLAFVLKATGWKDKTKIKERIESVLDKVAMKTKGFKFPHELSGGEQQRIAIARALLNEPELILADEPTGNLNSFPSEAVLDCFTDINAKGQTILLATHEINSAIRGHRVIYLEDGRITDQILFKSPASRIQRIAQLSNWLEKKTW